jgi:hypothetical protein
LTERVTSFRLSVAVRTFLEYVVDVVAVGSNHGLQAANQVACLLTPDKSNMTAAGIDRSASAIVRRMAPEVSTLTRPSIETLCGVSPTIHPGGGKLHAGRR